jgi:hypothetical protein
MGPSGANKRKFQLIKKFSIYEGTAARFVVSGGALLYLPGAPPMQPRCGGWCAPVAALSFLVDWKPVKRVDVYAGVMVSNVYGGLANGFLNVQNIDPAAGVRVRF